MAVVAAGRTLFGALTAVTGAPLDDTRTLELGLAVVWGISIPWAIIGTKGAERQARGGRRNTRLISLSPACTVGSAVDVRVSRMAS